MFFFERILIGQDDRFPVVLIDDEPRRSVGVDPQEAPRSCFALDGDALLSNLGPRELEDVLVEGKRETVDPLVIERIHLSGELTFLTVHVEPVPPPKIKVGFVGDFLHLTEIPVSEREER